MNKLWITLTVLVLATSTIIAGKPIRTPCQPCYGRFWLDSKDMGPICNAIVKEEIKKLPDGDPENLAAPQNKVAWDKIHEAFNGFAQNFGDNAVNMDQEKICKGMIPQELGPATPIPIEGSLPSKQ